MEKGNHIFRGRLFTAEEIEQIKNIIKENWAGGRNQIAKIVCERINWRQINGRIKKVSCLEALRRMQQRGIIELPASSAVGGYYEIKSFQAEDVHFREPQLEFSSEITTDTKIIFKLAKSGKDNNLWRYLIGRYHYLGYKRIVGRYLKYFIMLNNSIIALIGFSDGIYHHHLRDSWIEWDRKLLDCNRHLIVNNCRFLILPWVKIHNLGSKILSEAARVVPVDWQHRYGYKPLLFETFVDRDRFRGTVYRAANWVYLGATKGKGRKGLHYYYHGNRKDYYIYFLTKNALHKLKQS
ncbi:MAG: hypothetical protein A2Y62_04265 [Candidatus Fischerbacteria bacterium RBG_13_37_8]|uniref:Uncharacterized protein n=1 Tax=Candidatus Fischerbacteria bacterium RBG_13_37_8 TaxID=1817863 RepID=A0A1F5VHI8_9BACT|nr:MAG: hypothetical protein A2Y62_04265 [Candidatus Fischerbacteria bacterium RBG_13_37_8]